MGSGRDNRKKKDAPYIRRPKNAFGMGAGIPDIGEMAAETCIPSFDKRVNKVILLNLG
ncbi:MAG: hypothetical protein WDO71_22935 [Bacteroidota bacterium]